VSSARDEFDDLLSLYLPVAIGVFVLVSALILGTLVRYRRRRERTPAERSSLPLAEGLAALMLAAVATVLVTATFRAEDRVDATLSAPVRIRVVAFQWGWSFHYPGHGVVVVGNSNAPPTFAVPVGEPVQFSITSRDVIHSFWIPSERFKRDAFPDRVSRFDLEFDSPGLDGGRCAEFCGLRHDAMGFDVLAMRPAEFSGWLRDRRGSGR
jgi:cytochrome c oxidase subunit 2